jgi:PUA domain protein
MSSKIKNRHRLKNKEIKNIQDELQSMYNQCFFDEKSTLEIGDLEGMKIILVDDAPCFIIHKNKTVFTLRGIYKYKPREKFVVVDMGAVQFVTNGADVMAPGVVDADKNIKENDQVWICEERHHKPLAVGIALMNGENMIKNRQGKAARIIHYVGDTLWNLTAKSL